MGRGGMVRRGRRRRRRRIIGTAVVASSIANNNQRRRQQQYHQQSQQDQIRQQQYEIDRLKAEQRRAKEREREKNQQPKVVYVQAPPPQHTAQHVQKLSGVQQVEYVPHPTIAQKQPSIVYVHGPPPQNEGNHHAVAVAGTTAAVAGVAYQHQQPSAPAYNPQAQVAQPLVPTQTVVHQQAVQQHAGGLSHDQHNYVQPAKEKIVYVEKPVEKIVYVDKKQKEEENLIHKQEPTEAPPPKSDGGCCTIL